jgi:arylsulfatase A-like enzyme
LLAALEPLGVAGDTLVVLTADHGESLGEHDYYFNHGHVAYEEQVRVPLILRWPAGRYGGRRIAAPVELRGLGPTVIDALGLERGGLAQAASWLPAIRGRGDELPPAVFTAAGSTDLALRHQSTLVVRRGPMKLLLPRSRWAQAIAGGRSVELYDLSTDPDEARDLAPERPELVRSLTAEVVAWFDAHPARKPERPPGAPELREETRRSLRELGYLD